MPVLYRHHRIEHLAKIRIKTTIATIIHAIKTSGEIKINVATVTSMVISLALVGTILIFFSLEAHMMSEIDNSISMTRETLIHKEGEKTLAVIKEVTTIIIDTIITICQPAVSILKTIEIIRIKRISQELLWYRQNLQYRKSMQIRLVY